MASMTDLQLCIRELQSEFGVDVNFSHESGSMVLTGSLLQIQCAQTKLDNIFREQQVSLIYYLKNYYYYLRII